MWTRAASAGKPGMVAWRGADIRSVTRRRTVLRVRTSPGAALGGGYGRQRQAVGMSEGGAGVAEQVGGRHLVADDVGGQRPLPAMIVDQPRRSGLDLGEQRWQPPG